MIEDFGTLGSEADVSCDVCVVGSGPAGLAIADTLAGTALRVLVLETGGEAHRSEAEVLSTFETMGQRRVHHTAVRRRIFGGTSVIWSGRCVPFARMDFQQRDWIGGSGWPIDAEDVEPYLARAGRLLGLGPAVYDDRLWRMLGTSEPRQGWDGSKFEWQFFQASLAGTSIARQVPAADECLSEHLGVLKHNAAPQAADVAQVTRARLQAASNVRVWLNAHVRHIVTDEPGRRALGVAIDRPSGGPLPVRARAVVLACGGIDNARLLLLSDHNSPGGLGNHRDQVGRHLMDHHYAAIGQLPGAAAARLRRRLAYHWLDWAGQRHVYYTGVSLSAQRQYEDRLTRGTIYLVEQTRSPAPVSSAGTLLRAIKNGRRDAIPLTELRNLARHPIELLEGIYDRYRRKRPPLAIAGVIDIGCNVEQVPDPSSRVTLGTGLDRMGQRVAQIDWRLDDLERETYAACAKLFSGECKRLRLGEPTLALWLFDPRDDWRSRLHDMAHPMGTTRMSDDPASGVVDRNCAVHGVGGLYVAGSSVFATAGTANPTLLLTSLSVRLADHLNQSLGAAPSGSPRGATTPAGEASATNRSPRRVRIGIIGAGDRMGRVYRPVLDALRDRAEVVGFTCRDAARGNQFASVTGWNYAPTLAELMSKHNPEVLIIAVAGTANVAVASGAIEYGVPILAETPIAWDEASGRALVKRAADRAVVIGIAEQFPFLPVEQLKRKLIELGVLGEVIAAVNAFASFDYHGIAQLRAYLGERRVPVLASAIEHDFGRTGVVDDLEPPVPELGWRESWLLGSVKHADGALLVHEYSAGYSVLPTRPAGRLFVHGRCGSLIDDALDVVDRRTGARFAAKATREHVDGGRSGRLRRLWVEAPGIGTVEWHNPFPDHVLDDEQIAVACHVEAMLRVATDGAWPLYSAAQALKDIELLRALSYSSRLNGAPVRLPITPAVQRLRVAPHELRRRVDRLAGRLTKGRR